MEATIYSYMDKPDLYIQLPNPGSWVKRVLQYKLGQRCHISSETDRNGTVWWTVKKVHLDEATEAFLEDGLEGVTVIREYSTKVVCTVSCQDAKEDVCVCSCGGKFHRSPEGEGWRNVIGDVLIRNERQIVTRYFEGKDEA